MDVCDRTNAVLTLGKAKMGDAQCMLARSFDSGVALPMKIDAWAPPQASLRLDPEPGARQEQGRAVSSPLLVASAPEHGQVPGAPDATPDYADLFEQAPVGYMLLDPSGSITCINQTGARILGWDVHWLMGQPFSRWVEANDVEAFENYCHQVRSGESCLGHELRIKSRHGRVLALRLRAMPERFPETGATGCRVIVIDISGEQQTARELRRLQSQLNHVARLNTVGEMASSLAHELNQPLGTVVLNCEAAMRLLLAEPGNAGQREQITEVLAQAVQAASFASGIVRHLRGFLRDNSEEPHRTCDLQTLIVDISGLILANARDSNMELRLDIAPDLPAVEVDSVQIEQVLLNLAHNGIEAMRERGMGPNVVTIRARLQSSDRILVSVADTGPGVEPQQHERMFAPFYTTKRDGMGMGLCISRTIVEAHGGRLWASSDIGRGATFHFTLSTCADSCSDSQGPERGHREGRGDGH